MNQLKQTSKEIKDLRKAFRIEYSKFKEGFNSMQSSMNNISIVLGDLGTRMYELSKNADLLLNVIEQLNETELNLEKLQ